MLLALLVLTSSPATTGPTPVVAVPDASPTLRGAVNAAPTQRLRGKTFVDAVTVNADAGAAIISTCVALASLGACTAGNSLQCVTGQGFYECQPDAGWAPIAVTPPVAAPIDVLAPPSGAGMVGECATTNPTTANGNAIFVARVGVAQCVTGDGQKVVSVPSNVVRVKKPCASCSTLGLLLEDAVANRVGTASRDLSGATFVKTNMTCTHTAPGMRGNDVNGASRCTATANNATVLVTVASSNFAGTQGWCASAYAKRFAGNNAVSVTGDGSNFTAITPLVSSSMWRRVAQASDINFDTTIHVAGLCAGSGVNAVFGFKLAVAGDAIDVDFVQVETNDVIDQAGGRAISLSPVELVDANPIATHHDNVGFYLPDAGFGNIQGCVGYTVTWGSTINRYACPQVSTDSDGGFFAYYDIPPNFWLFDKTNNPGPVNDGVTDGVAVSTEMGWASGAMFGRNSNGASLGSAYNNVMIGGGSLLELGSQFQIPGNPCWLNGVMSNIVVGATSTSCHW